MTGHAIAEFTGRASKPVILGAELSLNKLPRLVGRLTYTLIQKFFKLLSEPVPQTPFQRRGHSTKLVTTEDGGGRDGLSLDAL